MDDMDIETRTAAFLQPHDGVTGLARLARIREWDSRLGTAYARAAGRRSFLLLGRLLVALVFVVILIGKWHAFTRIFAGEQPGSLSLASWTLGLNQLLQGVFALLLLVLVMVRRSPRAGVRRASGIVAAVCGTIAPSFLVYQGNAVHDARLALLGVVLLLLGMGWATWSLAVLGRCFSVLPEVRGLVTRVPYRWVRHPAYLGEMTATLGLLLPILSTRNVAVFALFVGLQLWRMRNEEVGLLASFPEYATYRGQTARLLPCVW